MFVYCRVSDSKHAEGYDLYLDADIVYAVRKLDEWWQIFTAHKDYYCDSNNAHKLMHVKEQKLLIPRPVTITEVVVKQ